jgi:protein-S-isoprenylcysteine O-methyltransferase Ste14
LAAQGLFLGVYTIRALRGRRTSVGGAPRSGVERTAPGAWTLLVVHGAGIVLVSWGIARTFILRQGRFPVDLATVLGLLFLLAAPALSVWALRVFTSWRFLARLEASHTLCTDGPYRFVRHPIYLAMDLWALGSTLACPAAATVVGMTIVLLGSDLRARAEEALLTAVFGQAYRDYMARTQRFVPGLY